MWPFRDNKPEAEARADHTEKRIAEAFKRVSGYAGNAGALAVAEACVGLWERALASATVTPDNRRMTGVSPQFLALAGRTLAAKGEIVAAIRVVDGQAMLTPATSWDVDGGVAPESWFYRVDFAGPSTSLTEVLPGAAVVHLRIGSEIKSPWRGKAPLSHARETAALAVALEEALKIESKLPIGRVAPYSGPPDQSEKFGDALASGGIVAVGASVPVGTAGGQEPARRHQPQKYGPEPDTVLDSLRSHAEESICAAFGISPTLFAPRGDGSGQREAWRRFWTGTVAPLGRIVAAELRMKLDPGAALEFGALRASDEDGRSRAAARRAMAWKTFRDGEMMDTEARRLAGIDDA